MYANIRMYIVINYVPESDLKRLLTASAATFISILSSCNCSMVGQSSACEVQYFQVMMHSYIILSHYLSVIVYIMLLSVTVYNYAILNANN